MQRKEVTEVRTLSLLVISVVKRDILLMYVGVRRPISRKNPRTRVTITNTISKGIEHITVGLGLSEHQDLMVTTTTTRSMVIELLSADQILCGHQTNQQRPKFMDITTIGITTLGRAITTIQSMDRFIKIALQHILMVITIGR